MKTNIVILCSIVVLFIFKSQAFESTTSPFYDFAERIHHTQGLVSFSYTQPFSRQMIVTILKEMLEKRNTMSDPDKGLLDYYIEKYHIENAAVSIKKPFHLVDYTHENGTLTLDLAGRGGIHRSAYDSANAQTNNLMYYTSGITFRGTLGADWDYYCFFVDETLHGLDATYAQGTLMSYINENDETVHETYVPINKFIENGGYGWVNFQPERKEMYFDRTRAYMAYSFPFGYVEIGKNTNAWGPGVMSHAMISDNAAPYMQFKTHFQLGKFRLTSTTAQLRTNELDPNTKIETDIGDVKYEFRKKYLASHRLEVAVSPKITVAVTESVIYADKNVQLGYMIPFNVFWSEQHQQGDRDNVALGMDISVTPFDRFNVYGELFFDDVSFKHLKDFRRTKAAYIAGVKWYPDFFPSTRVLIEYSRVNPIVYTHRFNVDNFTHANSNIGSYLYPNSDYIHAALSGVLTSRMSYRLYTERRRHGMNYIADNDRLINVGGDMYRPDTLSGGHSIESEIQFLDGILETKRTLGASVTYRVDMRNIWGSIGLYDLFIDAGVERVTYSRTYPHDTREKPVVDDAATGLYLMIRYNYD